MLGIGRLRPLECRGWTRRELLGSRTLSAVGVYLADVLRIEAGTRFVQIN